MDELRVQPLDALVEMLATGDAERRRAVAAQLGLRGRAGDRAVIPVLIRLLNDAGEYVDEAASDALWHIGEPVVMPLLDVVRDRDASLAARCWAVRTLSLVHDGRAVEPIVEVIGDATEPERLRTIAAFYTGRLGDEAVVGPLVETVRNPSQNVELRVNAIRALGEMKDRRATAPLMRVLQEEDVRGGQGPSLHGAILDALRWIADPGSLEFLLGRLESADEHRVGVAAALGGLGEPARGSLLRLLGSDNSRLREGAARALGFMEDPWAVEPLIVLLHADPNWEVRAAAAESLQFLSGPRVIDPLVGALDDDHVRVRLAAAQALFGLAHDSAVRADAVRALPALRRAVEGDPGTIQGHLVVREAAARAVRDIERVGNQ